MDNNTVSDEKKVRNMTLAGFLQKAGKPNVSARAFLGSNEAWIAAQPGGSDAISVIKEVHAIAIPATEALHKVVKILSEADIEASLRKAHEKAEKKALKEGKVTAASAEPSTDEEKPHTAEIVDEKGNVVKTENTKGELVDLKKTFAMPQEAKRWAARRLDENPNCDAILTDARHSSVVEIVKRDEAIAFITKKNKSPITAKSGAGPGSQKCSQDRAHFSHGLFFTLQKQFSIYI